MEFVINALYQETDETYFLPIRPLYLVIKSLGNEFNRAFRLVVFNNGQNMALIAFYFIRTLTKALTCYYINRSQRHLLAAFENNGLEGLIPEEKYNQN